MTIVAVELARTASGVVHPLWLTSFSQKGDRLAIEGKTPPIMSCPSCHSPMNREFTAEINIHFPGLSGLDKPTVWVFPRLSVCLGCGCAQFKIPDEELKQLQPR